MSGTQEGCRCGCMGGAEAASWLVIWKLRAAALAACSREDAITSPGSSWGMPAEAAGEVHCSHTEQDQPRA